MTSSLPRKTVFLVESQPITAEGVRAILNCSTEFDFRGSLDSLTGATAIVAPRPDLVLIDKAFGSQALVEWLTNARLHDLSSQVIVWGNSISEPEALRFLQCGVKGILRKTANAEALLTCLRAVAGGSNWMEESLFRESAVRADRGSRSELTPREQQVLELVEQGFKNKEIARELGIRPGTVKIHLKHIFEKTGVRGRYGLALTGLRDKGMLEMSPV